MKRIALQEMTVEQLVEQFTTMALEQDNALLEDEIGKYNRLYDKMEELEQELKERDDDQRRLLLPLIDHPNSEVRLKAAIATLSIDPEAARQALQHISDNNEYPQAAYARGMMKALDEGRYVPS
jgi:hypothetical protein